MNNIMLDLECFDSERTAIIVSIGAVYFDLEAGNLGDEFYVEITLQGMKDQLQLGRSFSLDTFQWWMQQNDTARSVFLKNDKIKLGIKEALEAFTEFVNKSKNVKVWGNGVDYDNVVLRDTYQTMQLSCPWMYRNNRCYRTIKGLFGNRAKLVREGTHHNGLDDAKTQAMHLINMMKKAKG